MAKAVIKIGHIKITDHLVLGISKAKLDRSEEKFDYCDLQTVAKTGWHEVAGALSSGEVDGACILAPTAMDLYKSGIKSKLVLLTHKTGSILVINKKAGVKKVEDFKNKVVLIPYQLSIHNMLFHRLLTEKGLKPGTGKDPGVDVKLEVMAPSMMPQAIEYDEEGEIAGYIVAEPYGSQAIKGGYGEEFCLSKQLWPDHPCCVLVIKDEVIGKHPDAVQELVNSLVASGRFVEDSPDEAAEIGSKFLSQETDVVKRVLTDPPDRIKTGALMPVIKDLEIIQNYMFGEMNTMKSKIDLNAFVDTQFAKTGGAS